MIKNIRVLLGTVLVLLLGACTVDLAQTTPTLPAPQVQVVQDTPEASTSQPTRADPASSKPVVPAEKIPITWASSNLSGKLIFLSAIQKDTNPVLSIQELDLATGDLYTLFKAPELSWIYTLTVSPDAKQLVFAYTPPANGSSPTQALYRMAADGSQAPEMIFKPPAPEDQYLQPLISPDGLYLYFAHTNYKTAPKDQHYPSFEIYRMRWPDGKPEKVADNAFWPRLSQDGSKLVSISTDPDSGKNKIYISAPDGTNSALIPLGGNTPPDIIDAPVFSPDGKSLLFSAPLPQKPASSSWMDRLLGVTVVDAHTVPSEWWQVPISGGTPVQLTHIQAPGLYAALSPDQTHFACFTSDKLFVMNTDASNLVLILDNLGGVYGSVSWIP